MFGYTAIVFMLTKRIVISQYIFVKDNTRCFEQDELVKKITNLLSCYEYKAVCSQKSLHGRLSVTKSDAIKVTNTLDVGLNQSICNDLKHLERRYEYNELA